MFLRCFKESLNSTYPNSTHVFSPYIWTFLNIKNSRRQNLQSCIWKKQKSVRTPLKIHHRFSLFLPFLIHLLIKSVYYPFSVFSLIITFLAVDISSLDHYDNNPTLSSIPIFTPPPPSSPVVPGWVISLKFKHTYVSVFLKNLWAAFHLNRD